MAYFNSNLSGPRGALTTLLLATVAGCSARVGGGPALGTGGGPAAGAGGAGTTGTAGTAGTTGTTGTAGTGGAAVTVDACLASPAPNPGRSPLRRLNGDEYRRTIRDLLPSAASLVDTTVNTFPLDEEQLGFTNNADALTTGLTLAQSYITAAEAFATAATTTANLTTLLSCDPSVVAGQDACAQTFIAAFGQRALRRPLTATEKTRYLSIYTIGKPDGFAQGISLVIQSFLESPYFLYRVEQGTPTSKAGVAAMNPYEMASRLSYFIWGSMPDAQLFADSAASKLGTVAQVEAEARRMLADPKARQSVGTFHQQWLGIGGLGAKTKDATLFSAWTPAIVNDQFSEISAFLDDAFWTDGHSETLLTSPYTFVNAELARFYGMTPPSGTGFVKTKVDVTQRAGILTQGSLMAILSYDNQTSPIHRGKFVRNKLLCQELALPPPNIAAKVIVPPVDPSLSTRQRFAAHEMVEPCATCHKQMDPIGLGFENFDPVGRWRTKDGTFDVDATGNVMPPSDVSGPFNGPVELAGKLAQSQQVRECIVTEWFRFANGRAETTDLDPCTLQTLKKNFETAGHDMREIPIQLAVSDAFRFRSMDGGGP